MTTALGLLFASAIVGLATGLYFRVWALLLVSPATAIFAAFVLQLSDFGFWTGVSIIIGSLTAGQLAYVAGAVLLNRGELSAQDDVDSAPGQNRQHGVRDENE